MTASLLREAADQLENRAAIHVSGVQFQCGICKDEPSDDFKHDADCLVQRLRTAADQMEKTVVIPLVEAEIKQAVWP